MGKFSPSRFSGYCRGAGCGSGFGVAHLDSFEGSWRAQKKKERLDLFPRSCPPSLRIPPSPSYCCVTRAGS